jgi:hypothetical protein
MDGFKSLPKMQCFKEGGSVKNKMPAFLKKETKSEVKKDKAQDKSMVKKGVKQHESALHKGEPKTELKLKTGGRAKKATGTVKKFEKASGEYGAKKTAQDKKNIKEAKQFKPAFKDGGKTCDKKVKKMQTGGAVDVKDPQALVDKIALEENTADANIIPNALRAVKRAGKKVIKSAKDMFSGQSAVPDADKSNISKRNGGKVKKYAEGGAVLSDEEKNWLGGADATDPYILARMRSALGDKKPAMKPQMAAAPSVQPAMNKPYQAPNVEQDSGLAYPQENEMRSAPMAPPPVRRPVRRPAPYQAPNVEQDSGLAYPQENQMRTGPMAPPPVRKPGFFSATPGQQADQFRRSAEQRKRLGMKMGNTLGLNKPPVN